MTYIGDTIFRKLHCSISAVIQNEVHTSLIPGIVPFSTRWRKSLGMKLCLHLHKVMLKMYKILNFSPLGLYLMSLKTEGGVRETS